MSDEQHLEDGEQLQIAKEGEPKYGSTSINGIAPPGETEEYYTVQQALDHYQLGVGNLMAIGTAVISNFGEGSEMMILPIILPKLKCEWDLSALLVILVPISVIVASTVGSGVVGLLSGQFGRLTILKAGLFISFIFAAVSAFSQNIWHFLLLRTLLALTIEVCSCITQVYVIEMSAKKNRALMESLNMFMWAGGSLASAGLAYFFLETLGWRVILLLLAIPILVCAIIMCFQHESPFYDVACGNLEGTQKTLDFICQYNKRERLPGKVRKHDEVDDPRSFSLSAYSFTRTFIIHSVTLVLLFGGGFFIFGFTSWATPRITDEGYCNENFIKKSSQETCHRYSEESLRALLIGTTGELFGNLVFYLIADWFGRLPSLKIAAAGNTLVLASMLFCGGMLKITLDIFLIRFLNYGLFVTLLVYLNEYYPTHMRGLANALAFLIGRTFSLLVIIPALLIDIEDMDVLIFGTMIVGVLTTIGTFVLTKETKDMDLI